MQNVQIFSEFFAAASEQYYRRARIGEDFITAVSVGELFGRTLAQKALQIAMRRWFGEDFAIVEFGAAGGELMGDVMAEISRLQEDFEYFCNTFAKNFLNSRKDLSFIHSHIAHARVTYYVSEPKAELRAQQKEKLGDKFLHIDANFTAERAIIIANELFDALPFELVADGYLMGVCGDSLAKMQRYNPADFHPQTTAQTTAQTTPQTAAQTTAQAIEIAEAFCVQNGEIATGAGAFLCDLAAQFGAFSLLAFDYACAHATAVSTRVFAAHRAPLNIREADLAALRRGAADVTFSPAIDQLRAYANTCCLGFCATRQAAWLIAAGAAEIAQNPATSAKNSAQNPADIAALAQQLKHLCFGLSQNFYAFEISK